MKNLSECFYIKCEYTLKPNEIGIKNAYLVFGNLPSLQSFINEIKLTSKLNKIKIHKNNDALSYILIIKNISNEFMYSIIDYQKAHKNKIIENSYKPI